MTDFALTQQSVDTIIGYVRARLGDRAKTADEAIDMCALNYNIHREKIAHIWADFVMGNIGNSGSTTIGCVDYAAPSNT